jgi:hypothetical protein
MTGKVYSEGYVACLYLQRDNARITRDMLAAALQEIYKLQDTAYENRDFGQQVGLIARNALTNMGNR